MTSRFRSCIPSLLPRAALAALALVFATSSLAQFKVIGADGKVTYTDREPNGNEGKVIPLGARAAAIPESSGADLPYELKQAADKYPVTLYVSTGACDPCATGRQLLKGRGIPFTEHLVVTSQDADALQRLSGAQEAPTLSIGSQVLRGLSPDVWNSYLDAAGYPRTSRLPATYQYRAATPVVEQQAPALSRPDTRAAAAAPAPPQAPPPASPSGIRF
jgi:glutaredoxin